MLHVGLDLSRRRLDVCVLSDDGELVEELAAPPDAEGLRYLVGKLARHRQPVRAVIESALWGLLRRPRRRGANGKTGHRSRWDLRPA
jgi:hypothetical protein